MKKKLFLIFLGSMLLLIPGALWAGNQIGVSPDTPAILVSLGQSYAIPLDEATTAAVRGQAQYVLVKVFGLNMFDFGDSTVKWTWNPLGYRYGNWGGPGWSGNPDPSTVDTMDFYFMNHDQGKAGNLALLLLGQPGLNNDAGLLALLTSLPNTSNGWGPIYVTNANVPHDVYVYLFSLIGGGILKTPTPMPYSEYSRREAMYGVQFLIIGKKIIGL